MQSQLGVSAIKETDSAQICTVAMIPRVTISTLVMEALDMLDIVAPGKNQVWQFVGPC